MMSVFSIDSVNLNMREGRDYFSLGSAISADMA